MADPRTKARRSAAKDARQMPAECSTDRRMPSRKRKPWVVESRYPNSGFAALSEWHRFGRYQSQAVALEVVEQSARKYGPSHEFRIRP